MSASGDDFEDTLQHLRGRLESQGLHLLCNRFRRDAFASPVCRQMSNGLSCYLVLPGQPVDPERIVACLHPGSARDVVSVAEPDRFIVRWKKSAAAPGFVRWIYRLRP